MSDDSIEEMFSVCLEKVKGEALSFVENLHEYWEKKGFLTEKQEQALQRFYDKCV